MTAGMGHGTTPLPSLPPFTHRWSTLYLDRSSLTREDNGVVAVTKQGTVHVPVSNLCALLLGPGTSITHQAVTLIADAGCSIIWVGDEGVRFYASGQGLSRSSRLLEVQARLVSTRSGRLGVARRMYSMRYPGEDVDRLTMQQLRGREGARVRNLYAAESKRTGVSWSRRDYDRDSWASADSVNRALSSANSALYGLVHAGVIASGASPALGFIHTGDRRSFVYDIADLYKAETTIPIAFDVAASGEVQLDREVRYRCRDRFREHGLLDQIVRDIRDLLNDDGSESDEVDNAALGIGVLRLWDPSAPQAFVEGGLNYEDL